MNETVVTLIGNLTADPELRYTQNGLAVVNFTIAATPRIFNRQANEWKDGEALFMRCSAWRDLAEHISQSLVKGSRVIAQGRLKQRSFETQQGEKRTVVECDVDEIGPSLRYATAQVTRTQGGGGRPGAAPGSQDAQAGSWAAPAGQGAQGGAYGAPQGQGDVWGAQGAAHGYADEVPF